jgi:DNA modification methylase
MLGDCLDRMGEIESGTVDAIIADPPYGSTACAWDQRIDLARFWPQAKRLLSPGSPVVMFADMRYAATLIASNPKWFKYDIVWDKVAAVGFLDANRKPLRSHELMLVFGPKLPRYRPQKWQGAKPYGRKANKNRQTDIYSSFGHSERTNRDGIRFPLSIYRSSNANGRHRGKVHPTQKPVPLLSWLIRTFTDPGMRILDPVMGSGSTGVACLETGRDFIGIESDRKFFDLATLRVHHG